MLRLVLGDHETKKSDDLGGYCSQEMMVACTRLVQWKPREVGGFSIHSEYGVNRIF